MGNTVWVIGSIGIDMLARAPQLPKAGETVAGTDFLTAPGGKGLNQAIACARLGAPTVMIGCRGDDGYGHSVTDYMKDSGVDVSRVRTVGDLYTGTAVIFVADGGQNSIIVVPGANGQVTADDVVNLPVQPGDLVVAQFETPLPVTLAAFRSAQAKGARTILNPSPVLEGAHALITVADYVVLNEVELAIYSGRPVTAQTPDDDIIQAARALVSHDRQTIITTLGPRGAIAVTRQDVVKVQGLQVPAVDTVGAGDTFAGGLAVRLLAGDSLAPALEFANLAASLSVQKPGAAPSIPTLADVRGRKAAA